MVDAHGVVGGLCHLMEYAHLPAGLRCRCEHGKAELLPVDSLRAREGKQNAARSYFLESEGVKAPVTAQGALQGAAVLGKCRMGRVL